MTQSSSGARRKRGVLSAVLDGTLLFLALWGSVFSFSTAFALRVYPACLLAGCALGAVVFTAVFSLPKYRWAALLAIAAGWCWALWQLRQALVLGEISLRCSVVNACEESLGTERYIQPIAQLPDEVWQGACTVLVLAAVVPAALILGFAIVRQRSFWLTALASTPFLAVPLAFTITPAWLPLMAVLVCWGTLLLSSLTVRAGRKNWNRMRLTGLLTSALLLALLTAAMPQERYRRPAWADRANDKIVNWATELSDRHFSHMELLPGGNGGGLLRAEEQVDLAGAGPLRFSGRTVLDVRSSDLRGRIYLRGFSSAVYDGKSWGPLEDEAYQDLEEYWRRRISSSSFRYRPERGGDEEGKEPPASLEEQLNGFQPINFPALAARESAPGRKYAKISVRSVGPSSGCVYFPYHLLTTPGELSGAEFVQDSYLAPAEGVETHTLYLMPDSSPLDGLKLPEEAVPAERLYYNALVWDVYTRYPNSADLRQSLTDWVRGVIDTPEAYLEEGAENRHYQMLVQRGVNTQAEWALHMAGLIRDSLDFLAEYDPDTPAAPEGEDFTAYFLAQSRRGYCMHFASAAALLLRYTGIPARYVSGYVADIPPSGRVQVPDSAAHAWVEIYLEGYGWYPVEVTPAYAGGEPAHSGAGGEQAVPTPTPTPTPARTPPRTNTPRPTAAPQQEKVDLRPVWSGLIVLLAVGLLLLRRHLVRWLRRRRFAGADANRAAISAYRYLERLVRRGGTIPAQAQELAEKAKFSQHTLSQEERDAMTALAQREAEKLYTAASPAKRLLLRYFWALY